MRRELIHQVDIGVQAQVAGFVDHLVGTAFAKFRLQPFAVGIDRAHFRVERPGPQQHMAVIKSIAAAEAFDQPLASTACVPSAS